MFLSSKIWEVGNDTWTFVFIVGKNTFWSLLGILWLSKNYPTVLANTRKHLQNHVYFLISPTLVSGTHSFCKNLDVRIQILTFSAKILATLIYSKLSMVFGTKYILLVLSFLVYLFHLFRHLLKKNRLFLYEKYGVCVFLIMSLNFRDSLCCVLVWYFKSTCL